MKINHSKTDSGETLATLAVFSCWIMAYGLWCTSKARRLKQHTWFVVPQEKLQLLLPEVWKKLPSLICSSGDIHSFSLGIWSVSFSLATCHAPKCQRAQKGILKRSDGTHGFMLKGKRLVLHFWSSAFAMTLRKKTLTAPNEKCYSCLWNIFQHKPVKSGLPSLWATKISTANQLCGLTTRGYYWLRASEM